MHGNGAEAQHLFAQIIEYIDEALVPAGMIEDVMETDVGIDDLIEFVVVDIFVDFDEDPFQVFQFVRRDPFSCQAGCQFFQGAADLEDLGDILQGNIGDIRPAPGNHDDEAFQFQFADGFADRRPADAEFIGQLDFHEPFPRFEYAVLDGLAQGFADDFAQRLISI